MWFVELTGFPEISAEQVRRNMIVEGSTLRSLVNEKGYQCGVLETPTLDELRNRVRGLDQPAGKISVCEIIGDAKAMHADGANAGALFQVASQFNLLEMASPNDTPEQGVGRYELDLTQGPACAMAAGAETIFRNYFVEVDGVVGQSESTQIDCLQDIGLALGNDDSRLWKMRNGYALASEDGLLEINRQLESATETELDELRNLLRVGLQWNTEVTIGSAGHNVSQIYCSALPVAYSRQPAELWSGFGQLVLEATYEAAICAGILNYVEHGNNKVYLTLVGGGVFGNDLGWILSAIERALRLYREWGLEVGIVSYGRSNQGVCEVCSRF